MLPNIRENIDKLMESIDNTFRKANLNFDGIHWISRVTSSWEYDENRLPIVTSYHSISFDRNLFDNNPELKSEIISKITDLAKSNPQYLRTAYITQSNVYRATGVYIWCRKIDTGRDRLEFKFIYSVDTRSVVGWDMVKGKNCASILLTMHNNDEYLNEKNIKTICRYLTGYSIKKNNQPDIAIEEVNGVNIYSVFVKFGRKLSVTEHNKTIENLLDYKFQNYVIENPKA